MQDALLLPDRKSVQAINVGTLEGWKTRKWSCVGCPAQVFPRACDPTKKFDRVPHFYLKRHARHDNCTVNGLDLLVEKARKQPITAEDKLLSHLPTTVTFPDHVVTSPDGNGGTDPVGRSSSIHFVSDTRWHRASATSIYRVCRAHASLSEGGLRQTIPLDVEGCTGSNYRDVFHQLQNVPHDRTPPLVAGCIFYADLRLKQFPDYSNPSSLILKLNRGRNDGDSESLRLYELIIDWRDWTPQLRESFGTELEAKRSESWKRFLHARKENRSYRTDLILYFLGSQVEGVPFAFEVSEYRKLALIIEPNGLFRDDPRWGFIKQEPVTASSPISDFAPFAPSPTADTKSQPVPAYSQPSPVQEDAKKLAAAANAPLNTPKVPSNGAAPIPRSTSGGNKVANPVSGPVLPSSTQLRRDSAQPQQRLFPSKSGNRSSQPSRFKQAFRWIANIFGLS